jgi:AcrR family transcriptional regulator
MANTAATKASKRRPPQRRREEVLDAAAHVFFQKGYDAATTEDIANRLDILKGSLYYYVESKDQLLYEIISEVFQDALRNLEAVVSGEGRAIDRLRAAIVAHIVHLTKNRTRAAILLHEFRSLSEPGKRVIRGIQNRYERLLSDLVEAAKKEGTLRPGVDLRMASMTILGAANWPYRWFSPRGRLSSREAAEQIASILIDGLEAKGAGGSRNGSRDSGAAKRRGSR